MKIAIVLNGISRKKKKFYHQILPVLKQRYPVEVFETEFSNHAIQLSEEITSKRYDVMLSAGGDGTLHQVVNGALKVNAVSTPTLGIIPLGSGNDFAGTMGITGDPAQLISLIEANKPRQIDVGKISCHDKEGEAIVKYFINVCSLGMGPATVHRLEKMPRWMGTSFRYYASVLNTFLTHPTERFTIITPNWNWKGNARVVAVANGKSFGNKIYIAPEAKPDDGLFSTFIATDMPLAKFLHVLQAVKGKTIVKDKRVLYSTAQELEISSPDVAWMEAEGELVGVLPARIEIQKERIPFWC